MISALANAARVLISTLPHCTDCKAEGRDVVANYSQDAAHWYGCAAHYSATFGGRGIEYCRVPWADAVSDLQSILNTYEVTLKPVPAGAIVTRIEQQRNVIAEFVKEYDDAVAAGRVFIRPDRCDVDENAAHYTDVDQLADVLREVINRLP